MAQVIVSPHELDVPNDGLDVERFWHDNAIALRDPFNPDNPQTPMGIHFGYDAAFAELGLKSDMRRVEEDEEFAHAVARAFNDRAERIVGRRLLNEHAYDHALRAPRLLSVGELFECKRVFQSESWWLLESAHTPQELARLLDRVEKLDIRQAMLPDDFERERRRYRNATDKPLVYGKHLRGPVTLATSIYGVENLIYLLMDDRPLAERFRDVLLRVILEYYSVLDEVSDPEAVQPGFSFADDNCALLTADMYALFGQPILRAVFERFAPAPEHRRFQHSDSDMGHLLPLLNEVGLNAVNFGPRLTVSEIRAAMPRAIIRGQLAPFTFMRNNEAAIEREVRRDVVQAQPIGGLILDTAGSVNDGSRLTSLRVVMRTLQQLGRCPQERKDQHA